MTLYEIIGVDLKATKEEIKTAYRALAHKWHPDKWHSGKWHQDQKDDVTKRFTEISKAYKILSNDEARDRYDKTGNTDIIDIKKMAEDKLMKLFLEVIDKNSSEMIDNTDIIKFMTRSIKGTLKNLKIGIKSMSKNKKRLIKLRSRFKNKKDERNIFLLMINHQMNALKGQALAMGIQMKMWKEGLKILENYEDNKEFPVGFLGYIEKNNSTVFGSATTMGDWLKGGM